MPGEQVTWDLVTRTAPPVLADYAFDYIGYRNETGGFRQITTPSGGGVGALSRRSSWSPFVVAANSVRCRPGSYR
jgi:hypothetical protein